MVGAGLIEKASCKQRPQGSEGVVKWISGEKYPKQKQELEQRPGVLRDPDIVGHSEHWEQWWNVSEKSWATRS